MGIGDRGALGCDIVVVNRSSHRPGEVTKKQKYIEKLKNILKDLKN